MSKSAEDAFHFFRLFDVAFFAPGATIVAALWWSGAIHERDFPFGNETAKGVAIAAFVVLASYLLGMVCHAIQRVIYDQLRAGLIARGDQSAAQTPGWFRKLPLAARSELAIYFWYLRSTCWNVAIAVAVSAVVLAVAKEGNCHAVFAALLGGAGGTCLLWLLGRDLDCAMRDAAASLPGNEITPTATQDPANDAGQGEIEK